MYPYLRLIRTVVGATRRPPLAPTDESRIRLRVSLGDVDFYPELNNGRHLTMTDFGRMDLAIRTGLLRTLVRRRWGLTVAGSSLRLRHRIPLWARFELTSQVVGRDRLWFYLHHTTVHRGRTCSAALVKAGVSSRDGLVPVDRVLQAVGATLPEGVPDWVTA